MNVCRLVLKISVVTFVLFNGTIFGMKSPIKRFYEFFKLSTNSEETQIVLLQDLVIPIAACADNDTKHIIQTTCRDLYKIVSPHNIEFIKHPLFTASTTKINRMALVHSWNNNTDMVNAIRKSLPDDKFTVPYSGMQYSIEFPSICNKKYNTSDDIIMSFDMKDEIDLAIQCAVVCNDTIAIKNLVPKIRDLYYNSDDNGKSVVYRDLMVQLIKKGNKKAFKYVVQHDPYGTRKHNYHPFYWHNYTLLDFIDFLDDISHEVKSEYIDLCKQYGEQESDDLNIDNFCIIS